MFLFWPEVQWRFFRSVQQVLLKNCSFRQTNVRSFFYRSVFPVVIVDRDKRDVFCARPKRVQGTVRDFKVQNSEYQ